MEFLEVAFFKRRALLLNFKILETNARNRLTLRHQERTVVFATVGAMLHIF